MHYEFSRREAAPSSRRLRASLAVSATALLLYSAPPAAASDLTPYKGGSDAILFEPNWAGLYVGGQAGGLIGSDDYQINPLNKPGKGGNGGGDGGAAGNVVISTEGNGVVGFHLGHNWQSGRFVYGAEADVDAVNTLEALMGSVRGRIGLGFDRTLIYGTAGVAWLSVNSHLSSVVVGGGAGRGGSGVGGGALGGGGGGSSIGSNPAAGETGGFFSRPGESSTGFVAGGGLEYKLTHQVGLGVEGLYYTFEGDKLNYGFDKDFFSVRGRLTFHLDRNSGSAAFKDDGIPGVAVANWAGFYVGGHAGAQYDAATTIDSIQLANGQNGQNGQGGGGGGGGGGVAVARLDDDARFAGGLHAGYNWQNRAWVYGLEGDVTFGESDKRQLLASGRARLGYASGALLFYGTAGVAYANTNAYRAIFAEDGADGASAANGGAGGAGGQAWAVKTEDDKIGYVVGGGVDAKVTSAVTLGLEGLYYGFDNKTATFDIPANTSAYIAGDSADVFVVRSRLSYQVTPSQEPLK